MAKLSRNAMSVLQERYLLKDNSGKVTETPGQMFRRVAGAVAAADRRYGKKGIKQTEDEFFDAMSNLEFLPNSPTLMNAGTRIGQLSACFVLPIEDSIESIYDTLKNAAMIHQSGGGTGFDFSKVRPEGDIVTSTKGRASGPLSFMSIFDKSTDVIKQGGKRRGANQGMLRVDHPDIMEFISVKKDESLFQNFNLSVAVTDRFMGAVKHGRMFSLINPRTGKAVKKIRARKMFDSIAENAWQRGDPCIIFIDEINRHNPTPKLGRIEATNPCAEIPLLDYESCNLGSINLSRIVESRKISWNKLKYLARLGVHFLDNVIDANKFPLPEIEKITKANRKIGLGIMGFAEMLVQLGIPYDSEEALMLGSRVMRFITDEARKKSAELAEERGSFPNFRNSAIAKRYTRMRNATVTSLQPTGTMSIIAGTSSSIEPLFAIAFERNILGGKTLPETNPVFEKEAKKRGFYSKHIMEKISMYGNVQRVRELPADMRRVFVTAPDIRPEWHIKMQASFQRYVDNAISKTVNLPENASKQDVAKAFMLAYELKCKGVTVYRYGSREKQVFTYGKGKKKACISCA